jgi:hypothetical protein
MREYHTTYTHLMFNNADRGPWLANEIFCILNSLQQIELPFLKLKKISSFAKIQSNT